MLENFRANVLKHLCSTSIDIMGRGRKGLRKQSQKKPKITKDEKKEENRGGGILIDRTIMKTKIHYSHRRILLTQ